MYNLEINEEERTFLKESLQWAQAGFEERAAKYLGDPALPNYYKNNYQPKIMQFQNMQAKLNLVNLKEKKK